MKVVIYTFKSFECVEVFEVVERRGGSIYKTRSKGFAHRDRVKLESEVYAPLSTKLLEKDGRLLNEIELELMEEEENRRETCEPG